eukprot:GILJ01007007.1.p3 GENE.GILJ01007007.1~~GILJ01007007.1.p3  ORF type:complete len:112 (+),score=10.81 GILJ01007007.1:197-532(+)
MPTPAKRRLAKERLAQSVELSFEFTDVTEEGASIDPAKLLVACLGIYRMIEDTESEVEVCLRIDARPVKARSNHTAENTSVGWTIIDAKNRSNPLSSADCWKQTVYWVLIS